MTLVQVSCDTDGTLSGSPAEIPQNRPVVIMLHGFQYGPGTGVSCPHSSLYAFESQHPALRSRCWPKRMNIGNEEISAIGFGWPGTGSIWSAWRAADASGRALGRFISDLKTAAPHRPIHMVGHSMGVRVAMTALREAEAGSVNKVIALNAADFVSHVELAVARQERTLSLYNVTSRENVLFDILVEWCLSAHWFEGKTVGRGFDALCAVTLRLDQNRHLAALRRFGFALPAADKRICHWSTYLRPGTGSLYRGILDGALDVGLLKNALRDDPVLAPETILPAYIQAT